MSENPYESPRTEPAYAPPEPPPEADVFSRLFYLGAIADGAILVMSALLLDGGRGFQGVVKASLAFWIAFLIVLLIHRLSKTIRGDYEPE